MVSSQEGIIYLVRDYESKWGPASSGRGNLLSCHLSISRCSHQSNPRGKGKVSSVWLISEPRKYQTQRFWAKALVSRPVAGKSFEVRKTESRISLEEGREELVKWEKPSCLAETQFWGLPFWVPKARDLWKRIWGPEYLPPKGELGASASRCCHGHRRFSQPLVVLLPGNGFNYKQV